MTIGTRIAKAEADFLIAQRIAGGDTSAAHEYAQGELERYIALNGTNAKRVNSFAKRERFIKVSAADAIACAKKIVADGRAHYEDEHGLIVCTLVPDGSAGAFGYDRLI